MRTLYLYMTELAFDIFIFFQASA